MRAEEVKCFCGIGGVAVALPWAGADFSTMGMKMFRDAELWVAVAAGAGAGCSGQNPMALRTLIRSRRFITQSLLTSSLWSRLMTSVPILLRSSS